MNAVALQLPLFGSFYPWSAGAKAGGTSSEAAERQDPERLGRLREAALFRLRTTPGGLTADEIAAARRLMSRCCRSVRGSRSW